jgi:lysozyme
MMTKRGRNSGWIGLVFVIIVFGAYRLIQGLAPFDGSTRDREATFRMYPDFGIELPEDYAIHGIDVSRYQSSVNWGLVRDMKSREVKLGFAFIKATEGSTLTDKQFSRNWRKSRQAGVVRGAYHFFRAKTDAAAQARLFIKTVTLLPGDLPPVLDVESLDNETVQDMQDGVALWLLLVEQHFKIKPIIYTNATFYNNYLHPRFADYLLWVAHYKERNRPRVSREWLFWQHSESGRVNGINHHVDFNVFNGDSVAFRSLLVGGEE